MILTQLTQLICQILSRVTISGCFDFVVNLEIPGLEGITYFQILAAGVYRLLYESVESNHSFYQ